MKSFRKERYLDLFDKVRGLDFPRHFHKVAPEEATARDCKELATYLKKKVPELYLPSRLTEGLPKANRYEPWEVDLGWLNEQINSLKGLQSRLKKCMESYTHGVIYAVDFEGVNYEKIKNLNIGMLKGIACYVELEPEMILAKVRSLLSL